MPPWSGVAGEMVLELLPPNGFPNRGFANWSEMGLWYLNLTSGRRDASPQIKQEAVLLTASATTPAEKMKAFASFLQNDMKEAPLYSNVFPNAFQSPSGDYGKGHRPSRCDRDRYEGSKKQPSDWRDYRLPTPLSAIHSPTRG
jgi:hypothetical protein